MGPFLNPVGQEAAVLASMDLAALRDRRCVLQAHWSQGLSLQSQGAPLCTAVLHPAFKHRVRLRVRACNMSVVCDRYASQSAMLAHAQAWQLLSIALHAIGVCPKRAAAMHTCCSNAGLTLGMWLSAVEAPVTKRRQAFATTQEAEAELGARCVAQMDEAGQMRRLPARHRQVQRVRRIGKQLVQALALLPEEDTARQQSWLVCMGFLTTCGQAHVLQCVSTLNPHQLCGAHLHL